LQLTVIGSGTAVPQKGRSAPCYLIRHGGEVIVVDLGSGAVRGLLLHGGVTVSEIDAVLISHLHPDHCSDLVPLLFALRAEELTRDDILRILGPLGMKDHYGELHRMWGHWVEPAGYELRIYDWDGREQKWGEFRIRAAQTIHSVVNLAWHIEGPDARGVILTGDGEPTRELIQLGESSDHILVAECSLPGGQILPGHMNAAQAGDLARKCRSRKLVLGHVNPGVNPGQAVVEAKNHFGGEVFVAEDGMLIEV
jgi:ribonuclease BN (tRNA processing enzyme)